MRYGVLGPLTVHDGAAQPVTVPEAKVRALLAALLVHGGGPVPADRLIDFLWQDTPPGRPRNTLQTKVSQLRRVLGRAELVHEPAGYRLRLADGAVDARAFETLVSRARATPAPGAREELFTAALDLWRGEPYADVADAVFVRAEATRLDELRLSAVEERADARLALGRHADLAGELAGWEARYPLRERLRAARMRALYRAGRQNEALGSFLELRRRLADELGVDPGPEISALYEAILRQEPALTGPPAGVADGWTPAGPARTAGAAAADGTAPADGDTATAARPEAGHALLGPAGGLPGDDPAGRPEVSDGAEVPPAEFCCWTNLPTPLTRLVGRDTEVAMVRTLLSEKRLVTLTGPGGVGKTRLAVAAAAGLGRADHPDGVWLVELAGLAGGAAPDEVAERVVCVLGLCDTAVWGPDPSDGLLEWLAPALESRRMVLVLDNCEHLLDAVAEVAGALLAAAPGLRLLVTGQEPLGLPGETVRPVAPLPLPPAGDVRSSGARSDGRWPDGEVVRGGEESHGGGGGARPSAGHRADAGPERATGQYGATGTDADTLPDAAVAEIAAAGSVALFVERAVAAVPGFTLHAGNAAAVAGICRRLDGIPLALELVAARLPVLPPAEMLACLDNRFRLPAGRSRGLPPRQRTLRAMIDWSWDLLTSDQRTVLRRLSVAADGCDLRAAQLLCSDEELSAEDVLDALARLVDRSLVTRDGDRFRLLESVAAYGAERLAEAGESTRMSRRFVAHWTDLAEEAARRLRGPEQHRWLAVLDTETVNLRRALDAALTDGDPDGRAVRLVNALAWYWFLRNRRTEAYRWLAAALDGEGGSTAERDVTRAWWVGFASRTPPTVAEDRPRVAQASGEPDGHSDSDSDWWDGHAAHGVADPAEVADAVADPVLRARLQVFTAGGLRLRERAREGGALADRALVGAVAAGDRWGEAAALAERAACRLGSPSLSPPLSPSPARAEAGVTDGPLEPARVDGERAAALFDALDDTWGQLHAFRTLATVAERSGASERAVRCLRRAVAAAERLALWSEIADLLIRLGDAALATGDPEAARDFHGRALQLAVQRSYPRGEVRAATGLGRAALVDHASGDVSKEAVEHLRHAVHRGASVGLDRDTASARAQLALAADRTSAATPTAPPRP